MHLSSLDRMRLFKEEHLAEQIGKPLKILDIGSTEMGACYRTIFQEDGWVYVGADLASGPNVDVVLREPYCWSEFKSASFDVVVSGQVLEHVEYFWLTMLEMARVLKPGGLLCIMVPSSGPEHRYPVDCYRFYPDGMRAMGRFARLHVVRAVTHWEDMGDPGSDIWHDSVGIYQKPVRGLAKGLAITVLQNAQRMILRVGLG